MSAITIAGIGKAFATSGADTTAAIATAAESATPGAKLRVVAYARDLSAWLPEMSAKKPSASFRGARASKPGIQKLILSLPLDSGFAPSAHPE
jgi:hypothetical protein